MKLNEVKPFLKRLSEKLSDSELSLIEKAASVCIDAHKDQFRQSGKAYATHPFEVAKYVSQISMDAHLIAASFLHDVLEDTTVSEQDLIKIFNEDVCQLVKGVTKLGKIYFGTSQLAQVENYRRLFLATAEDLRVVIIKLCDRFHNMKTLMHLSPTKQLRISKETLDIFVPLANRLGMGTLKWELEDMAFFYLNPRAYKTIQAEIIGKREDREAHVAYLISYIKTLLEKHHINGNIEGRPKHFYSIYRKMVKKNMALSSIYDMFGLRIIAKDIRQCYEILGAIHGELKPMAHRIKDYIAMPKANMYQSLHTTVIGPKGNPVEIQIRTQNMHLVAEQGIAAHWKYKENASKKNYKANFKWLDELIKEDHEDPNRYLKNIKLDLFEEDVFVFSPKGDIVSLKKGATPLDYAYKVHSDIGNHCKGATINGHIVSLNYVLKNGDQIDILTAQKTVPKPAWLDLVKTKEAKQKIKSWFRKQNETENKVQGKHRLEHALLQMSLSLKEEKTQQCLLNYAKHMKLADLNELYLSLAYGDLSVSSVLNFIEKTQKPSLPKTPIKAISSENTALLAIKGETNIKINIAKCCHPFPGDDILGFITVGKGVTVHRQNCLNLAHKLKKTPMRAIEVDWLNHDYDGSLQATIILETYPRESIINEVVAKVLEQKYQLLEAGSKTKGNKQLELRIRVLSPAKKPLTKLMNTLRLIDDVIQVYRP